MLQPKLIWQRGCAMKYFTYESDDGKEINLNLLIGPAENDEANFYDPVAYIDIHRNPTYAEKYANDAAQDAKFKKSHIRPGRKDHLSPKAPIDNDIVKSLGVKIEKGAKYDLPKLFLELNDLSDENTIRWVKHFGVLHKNQELRHYPVIKDSEEQFRSGLKLQGSLFDVLEPFFATKTYAKRYGCKNVVEDDLVKANLVQELYEKNDFLVHLPQFRFEVKMHQALNKAMILLVCISTSQNLDDANLFLDTYIPELMADNCFPLEIRDSVVTPLETNIKGLNVTKRTKPVRNTYLYEIIEGVGFRHLPAPVGDASFFANWVKDSLAVFVNAVLRHYLSELSYFFVATQEKIAFDVQIDSLLGLIYYGTFTKFAFAGSAVRQCKCGKPIFPSERRVSTIYCSKRCRDMYRKRDERSNQKQQACDIKS